jgi:transcriptional regulator with XRE-family HTH domain
MENQRLPDVTTRLAARLKSLRQDQRLTIEELAARSGVSRATISKIERRECSPTAVVLNKLAIGLGVLLPALFPDAGDRESRRHEPVARRKDQPVWRDPETGYSRRTLTPSCGPGWLQLSEIEFPAGARVTFENSYGDHQVQQQIWMLEGELQILLGKQRRMLSKGDCMTMALGEPITFDNPGKRTARYLVAINAERMGNR